MSYVGLISSPVFLVSCAAALSVVTQRSSRCDTKAAFTRTQFHLHDAGRDRYRNRVDLKTLTIVERFQNDTVSSVV